MGDPMQEVRGMGMNGAMGRACASRSLRLVQSRYSGPHSLTLVSLLTSAKVHIKRLIGLGHSSVSCRGERYVIANGNSGRHGICFSTHAGVRLRGCVGDHASDGRTLFMSLLTPCRELRVDNIRVELHRVKGSLGVPGIRPRGFHHALTAVTVSGNVPVRRIRRLLNRRDLSAALRCTVIGRGGIGLSRRGFVN